MKGHIYCDIDAAKKSRMHLMKNLLDVYGKKRDQGIEMIALVTREPVRLN